MSSSPQTALMSRSPSSRKSLNVSNNSKARRHSKKRPKSIATSNPDDLTPRSKRRRSLAPKKSILKPSNFALSLQPPTEPHTITSGFPSKEEVTVNMSRMSLPPLDRRVSFAPNAQVRLIPKELHTNGSSTPPSSPMQPTDSADQSPDSSFNKATRSPVKAPRRSSLRYSVGEGEGEQSMELASDASMLEESSDASNRRDSTDANSSMDIDESQSDMDFTMNTTASGRASLAKSRRSSTRRVRYSNDSDFSEHGGPRSTDFEIGLEESLKGEVAPTPEWLALKAIMNVVEDDDQTPITDIDIETAKKRMLTAGKDIVRREGDDSFSSGGGDSIDLGDKTMDLTSLTAGLRRSMGGVSMDYGDKTMDLTSLTAGLRRSMGGESKVNEPDSTQKIDFVAPPEAKTPLPSTANVSSTATPVQPQVASSTNKSSIFLFSALASASKETPSAKPVASSSPVKGASSPTKPPRGKQPGFSAAFAPPVSKVKLGTPKAISAPPSVTKSPARTPLKRPLPEDEKTNVPASPALKKLIVTTAGETRPTAIPRLAQGSKSVQRSKSPSNLATAPPKRLSDLAGRKSSLSRRLSSLVTGSVSFLKGGASKSDVEEKAPASPMRNANASLSVKFASPAGPSHEECSREAHRQAEAEVILSSPRAARHSLSPSRPPIESRLSIVASVPATLSPIKETTTEVGSEEEFDDQVADEDQDPAEVDEEEYDEEEVALDPELREKLPHSIDEFLRAIGGEFMDNMTARRRSTMGLRLNSTTEDGPPTIADYAIGSVINLPQLIYYDFLLKHMEMLMDQIDSNQRAIDEDISENPPALFIDYVQSTPEQIAVLKGETESARNLARFQTAAEWYTFKCHGIEDLLGPIEAAEQAVLKDLRLIKDMEEEVSGSFEELEAEYERVMTELEEERASVARVEKCDKAELDEVKTSISDQATQIKLLEQEVADCDEGIAWFKRRCKELDVDQQVLQDRFDVATRICKNQEGGASIEFARINDEINLFQYLSHWQCTRISATRMSFEYDQRIIVDLQCQKWTPVLRSASVLLKRSPGPDRRLKRDWLPMLTDFAVSSAQERLVKGKFGKSTKMIIRNMSKFWTGCDIIRQEMMMLRTKFEVNLQTSGKILTVQVPILYKKSAAKILVEFDINLKVINEWPLRISEIPCRVTLGYALDETVVMDLLSIQQAVTEKLGQVTLSENFGIFIDVCAELRGLYE